MMKSLSLALLLFLVFGCSKLTREKIYSGSLTGKWENTYYYMSTGSPGSWLRAEGKILQLNEDSSVAGNYFSDKILRFSVRGENKDSVIIFTKADGSTFGNRYNMSGGDLYLSPYPEICIEGCAVKFERFQ